MKYLVRARSTAVGPFRALGNWADCLPILLIVMMCHVPVIIGASFSTSVLNVAEPANPAASTLSAIATRHDGAYYREIATVGYAYDPDARSLVAFFPAYPLIASALLVCFPITPDVSLLATSNVMLIIFAFLFSRYCRSKYPETSSTQQRLLLVIILLFPSSFFFRAAYSESTFLASISLLLLGMARRWPLVPLALAAGLATATRPVGLACTLAFLTHLLSRQSSDSFRRRLFLSLALLPLATWGILAFMAYQQYYFHAPFAFAQTQQYWDVHSRPGPWPDKMWSLLSFEPLYAVYDPASPSYWKNESIVRSPLFSLAFWNPIIFATAIALVATGWALRWLSGPEVVLGLVLLLIPYATRAHEMAMGSHARFASVDIPAYLVFGRLLWALPYWASWAVIITFSSALAIWSALFLSGYPFF